MIEDQVLQSKQFQAWRQSVEASGTKIDELKILGAISRDEQTLFNAFIDCVMTTPEGDKVPRCMLIRGNSVVVVPVIYCAQNEVYTLMVRQRRPIDGDFAVEFPGGQMHDVEDPVPVAVQEVNEELGLEVEETEMKPLSEKPVKVCSGMMDEFAYFYFFEKQFSKNQLQKHHNRLTGHNHDGEFLCVQVVQMKEVAKQLNFSALVGMKLLEKKLGKVF